MNYPIFLPTGAWCLWDSAQQLPLYLGKPWRDIFAELSKVVGLSEATAEMLAALDAPSRWEDVLREVEKDKGKIAANALKRLTRNGPPVRVCASVIRAELTRDRDQERREALEAQRGQNISIAKRKKKQAAASKEVAVVASEQKQEEVEQVKQVEQNANPEWEWQGMTDLARACGDRDRDAIRWRIKSDDPKWAHYEAAPVEEVEGDWHARAKHVYRIRPGYPVHALSEALLQQLREELGETVEEVEHQAAGDDAPARDESVKGDARIATLETALITAREKIADLEASLEDATTYCDERDDRIEELEREAVQWKQLARDAQRDIDEVRDVLADAVDHLDLSESNIVDAARTVNRRLKSLATRGAPRTDDADHYMRRAHQAEDALQRIAELAERHTSFTADELGADDLFELLTAAFEDAGKLSIDSSAAELELSRIDDALFAAETEAWEETSRHDIVARLVREKNINWKNLKEAEAKIKELEDDLAYQKKQEKGYQDAIGDLQMQVFQRGEELKELERRCTEAEHDLDIEAGHLDKIKRLIEKHTVWRADELSFVDMLSLLAAALGDMSGEIEESGKLAVLELKLEQAASANAALTKKLAEINGTGKEEVGNAIALLKQTINPQARCAAIPLEALVGHAVGTIEKQERQIKELEQQLAAHRSVSSSMVGLTQPGAPDTPVDWQEKLNALGEKAGLIIMQASQQQAEHIEALLSQAFDLVQALEREGVHLPVEARAWLWDVSKVEGAA